MRLYYQDIILFFLCSFFDCAKRLRPTTRDYHLQEIIRYKRLPITRDHSLQDIIHYKISPITKEKLYKKQLQEKSSAVALEYQIISCYYIISASLLN